MSIENYIKSETFQKLSPFAQGYWFHTQASVNQALPRICPYPMGSKEREQWDAGEQRAIKDGEGSMEAYG